jgi:hypothetical protein
VVDTEEFWASAPPDRAPGPAGGGLGSFLLGGLTAMEVLALVVGFVTVVGILWMTSTVAPERLVTGSWLRAGWALSVVSVVRPVTWIPYAAVFLGFRRLLAALSPRARPVLRNAGANAATIAVLGAAAALVLASVEGAARWTASVVGFVMGTVDVGGLGHTAGRWDASRIAAAIAAFVLIRPVLPPLGRDLDLRARPMLWFVEGRRGRLDAWLVGVTCASGVVVGAIAALRYWSR